MTTEEKREERWIKFEQELKKLLKKHNVEIILESENKDWYLDYFISFEFEHDDSKKWEEGVNDYFKKTCNYISKK